MIYWDDKFNQFVKGGSEEYEFSEQNGAKDRQICDIESFLISDNGVCAGVYPAVYQSGNRGFPDAEPVSDPAWTDLAACDVDHHPAVELWPVHDRDADVLLFGRDKSRADLGNLLL